MEHQTVYVVKDEFDDIVGVYSDKPLAEKVSRKITPYAWEDNIIEITLNDLSVIE